jgi:hypothetical protein
MDAVAHRRAPVPLPAHVFQLRSGRHSPARRLGRRLDGDGPPLPLPPLGRKRLGPRAGNDSDEFLVAPLALRRLERRLPPAAVLSRERGRSRTPPKIDVRVT